MSQTTKMKPTCQIVPETKLIRQNSPPHTNSKVHIFLVQAKPHKCTHAMGHRTVANVAVVLTHLPSSPSPAGLPPVPARPCPGGVPAVPRNAKPELPLVDRRVTHGGLGGAPESPGGPLPCPGTPQGTERGSQRRRSTSWVWQAQTEDTGGGGGGSGGVGRRKGDEDDTQAAHLFPYLSASNNHDNHPPG